MTEQEFYEYFYELYCKTPLSAQVRKQAYDIAHLKMEIAKLRKRISNLSLNKEDK